MKKALVIFILTASVFAGKGIHTNDQRSVNTNIGTSPYEAQMSKVQQFLPVPGVNMQTVDNYGTLHTRMRQMYRGIPVFGAEIIHHQRNGKVTTTGRTAIIGDLDVRPELSRARALAMINKIYGYNPFSARLVVFPTKNRSYLAWHFDEQSQFSRWQVFVDAHSGKIINAYNDMQSGTGTGVLGDTKSVDTTYNGSEYEMIASDGSRETYDAKSRKRTPGTLMTDADDVWTDGAAVDAHHYAGLTLDFYFEQFGRNSYDDQGAVIISSVHYDRNLVNAYWSGSQMLYGDGDGVNSTALSGGFDVVAHEISHAVTDATSNLIYQNESGALNEAFSDIMGTAAEYYKQNALFDWKLGEDIWTPAIAGDALRYMDDPTADGSSRDHYDDRYTGTADSGGVHFNSGIANLAFYLASEGGSHPTYGGSYTGVGIDAATQIFYTAFTQNLSSSATFADARAACTQVALDNYDQTTADRIDAAWDAVGAPADGGTGGPTEIQVAVGVTFESDHPYNNNENITWVINNPGASSITVDFSTIDMERNYDYVYVKDGNDNIVASFTGKKNRGATVNVNGDTAKVNMVTDPAVVKQGFVAVAN